jgi:hypothetical protein
LQGPARPLRAGRAACGWWGLMLAPVGVAAGLLSSPFGHFRPARSQPNPPPHPLPRPPPHTLPHPPPPPDHQCIHHHDIHRHVYLLQSTTGGTVSIASQTRGATFQ